MQFTSTRLKKNIYNKNVSSIRYTFIIFFYLKQNKIKQDFKKGKKKPPSTNERKRLRLKIGHPSANYG